MNIEYSKRAVKAINSMDSRTKRRIKAGIVPDDVTTSDDLEAIRAARREYANGETVSHEAINWE